MVVLQFPFAEHILCTISKEQQPENDGSIVSTSQYREPGPYFRHTVTKLVLRRTSWIFVSVCFHNGPACKYLVFVIKRKALFLAFFPWLIQLDKQGLIRIYFFCTLW